LGLPFINEMHYSDHIELDTKGFSDCIDLTRRVESILHASTIRNGLASVFAVGSTASITTIEYESGVVEDLKEAIERVAPSDIHYRHDARWGDGNGFSHVRAALMKPGLTIPVIDGALILGTWQQIVFIDFDNRPRERKIIVQIVGDR